MYDILMKYHVKHVSRTHSWSNKKHAWLAPPTSSLVGEGQKFLFWWGGVYCCEGGSHNFKVKIKIA